MTETDQSDDLKPTLGKGQEGDHSGNINVVDIDTMEGHSTLLIDKDGAPITTIPTDPNKIADALTAAVEGSTSADQMRETGEFKSAKMGSKVRAASEKNSNNNTPQ